MLKLTGGFSGFSVQSSADAREFYEKILGLEVVKHGYGTFIHLPDGTRIFFYPKGPAHQPATYTILNLTVDDIDEAVDELERRGVVFEHYAHTDSKGVQRGIASGKGPDQAWFQDPSGNIISILKEE